MRTNAHYPRLFLCRTLPCFDNFPNWQGHWFCAGLLRHWSFWSSGDSALAIPKPFVPNRKVSWGTRGFWVFHFFGNLMWQRCWGLESYRRAEHLLDSRTQPVKINQSVWNEGRWRRPDVTFLIQGLINEKMLSNWNLLKGQKFNFVKKLPTQIFDFEICDIKVFEINLKN